MPDNTPNTDNSRYELELIRAQTTLAIKQCQTEFWKIGVACVLAGAALGGVIVQMLNSGA